MKITKEQRKEIVKRYTRFRKTYEKIRGDNLENLARDYGVSSSRIHYIIKAEGRMPTATDKEND